MGHSNVKNYIHIVWSTYKRIPYIRYDIEGFVYRRIAEICEENKVELISVNSEKDHIHILLMLPKDQTLASNVKLIKGKTALEINQMEFIDGLFKWQIGYHARSVSPHNLHIAKKYIDNQKKHHKTMSYEEELIKLKL
jgi:REP element-mobilizing transposase RayT